MSDYEHKENSGSLFVNDKGDNPRRPDYTGDANIGGTLYRLSAWVNESKNGNKYLSVKFTEKDDAPPVSSGPEPRDDEPLPF